jgi:flagellar motor component MotA
MIPFAFVLRRRQDVVLPTLLLIALTVAVVPFAFGLTVVESAVLATVLVALPLWTFCSPKTALEGESVWQSLAAYDETTPSSQRLLEAIDELEYTATFARKNGMVALEKHLPRLNYSHAYLKKCMNYLLDAKTEGDLRQFCQLQEKAFHAEETLLLNTVFTSVQQFLPVACFVNVLAVLLALKGVLTPDLAGASLLMSLYAWASTRAIWMPLLEQFERHNQDDQQLRNMIQEGLQGVWKQVHPQALRRNLEAYLPTYEEAQGPLLHPHELTPY